MAKMSPKVLYIYKKIHFLQGQKDRVVKDRSLHFSFELHMS